MANSEALPEKKRTLPTLADEALVHAAPATDRTDNPRMQPGGSHKGELEKKITAEGSNVKRQRISDAESTNEEISEAGSRQEDESVRSEDNVIACAEPPPSSRDPAAEKETMAYKVPITPETEKDNPTTSVNASHPKEPKRQLGIGYCVETNQKNAAEPPRSGRIGTRSSTSARPRKVWSTSTREPFYEAPAKPAKPTRPKKLPAKRGDDEGSWYYYCPLCQHPFAFPKDEDLPPLDVDFNVSDHVPWGDMRFHQRIQTVRRHMRNKHEDFPESEWPAGFAKVSRSLDDDNENAPCVEIVDSDSSETKPAIGLRKGTVDKEYRYPCFIMGCSAVFRTRGWEPPLNDQQEISDAERWDSRNLVTSVRAHMRYEHPDIDEEEWPPGFAKLYRNPLSAENEDCYKYDCPVEGCEHVFGFPKSWNPPLTESGKVSDAVPWPSETFGRIRQNIHRHMRKEHPEVDKSYWPKGFGGVMTLPHAHVVDTMSGGCFNYHCPIPGCEQIFGIPKHLCPPLDWYGNVTDYYPWPNQLDYVRQWVHFHIRKDHADYLASYFTSPDGAVDESDETAQEGFTGAYTEDDGVYDVSDATTRAESKRCWCSYQQCWHLS